MLMKITKLHVVSFTNIHDSKIIVIRSSISIIFRGSCRSLLVTLEALYFHPYQVMFRTEGLDYEQLALPLALINVEP